MSTTQRVGRAARLVVTLVVVGGVGYGLATGDPSHAFPVVVPAAVVLALLRLLPGAGSTGGSSYDGSGSGSSSSSLWSTGSDAGSGGWSGGDSGGGGGGGGDSSGGGGSW
jgi:uncharacterized protein